MKKILFTMVAIVACNCAFAQTKPDTYYRNNPVWIQMMEKESANYNEAVKAFNLYWEKREKPTMENELFSASNEEKEKADFIKNKKKKSESEAVKYAFEYKKFMHWQRKVEPYINDDGTVMNAGQRIEIWKKQLENRK